MTSGAAAIKRGNKRGKPATSTGWAAAVVALLLVGAPAVAAERDGAADDGYRAGVELRRQGDNRGALREFRRAYAATPTPRTLAQIGLAEQAMGSWVDAEAHIGEALKATGDSWIATNRTTLRQALATVEAHLGTLEVECDTAGVALELNGVAAGSLPLQRPVRVAAGSVVLSARAPGFFPVQRVTTVTAGQLTHEQITMVRMSMAAPPDTSPRAAAAPQPMQTAASTQGVASTAGAAPPAETPDTTQPPPTGDSGQWRRPAAWVALGLAAASLGTGVTFHVLHQSRTATYNRTDATGATVCNRDASGNFIGPDDCADAFHGAASARTLAIVGYSGAALFGAVSAILFLTTPSSDGDAAGVTAFRHTATSTPRLACGMGPGAAGLACSGSF